MPGVSPEQPSTLHHQVPWSNRDVGAPWRNVKAAPWRRSRDLRRSKSPIRGSEESFWNDMRDHQWKRWSPKLMFGWFKPNFQKYVSFGFPRFLFAFFFGTAILSLPQGTWKKSRNLYNFDKTDCFWNALKDLAHLFDEMVSLPHQPWFNLLQGLGMKQTMHINTFALCKCTKW